MLDIIVIGSVAMDHVVRLDAPLRSGSHNQGREGSDRIGGGAANTAMALARGGLRVGVVSAVGADLAGEKLVAQLASLGVDTTMIDRNQAQTTRSLVLLDPKGDRTIVNLFRASVPVPQTLGKGGFDVCYVRSADPGLTPLMKTLAPHHRLIAHIPPLTPSFRPAHILVGAESDLPTDVLAVPYAAGRTVAGPLLQWVVITRGGRGATAHGEDKEISVAAPTVRNPVDTTGAGDAFAAGLCQAVARGAPMKTALREAVHWGTASVCYAGTVPPEDFAAALQRSIE